MDGAGNFRIFIEIIMPLSKPIIAVVALFSFTGPLGDFILASTILRTPDQFTLPIGLYNLVAQKMGPATPPMRRELCSSRCRWPSCTSPCRSTSFPVLPQVGPKVNPLNRTFDMKIKKTLVMAALLATGMLGMHAPAVAAENVVVQPVVVPQEFIKGLMSPCWPK